MAATFKAILINFKLWPHEKIFYYIRWFINLKSPINVTITGNEAILYLRPSSQHPSVDNVIRIFKWKKSADLTYMTLDFIQV